MSDYYDMNGMPISSERWGWLMRDDANRRVGRDEVADGEFSVSTVWLGLDHAWGGGPPLFFETMIFANRELDELDQVMWRYNTKGQAAAGHAAVVKGLEDGLRTWDELDARVEASAGG